jgi:hypothetical protein
MTRDTSAASARCRAVRTKMVCRSFMARRMFTLATCFTMLLFGALSWADWTMWRRGVKLSGGKCEMRYYPANKECKSWGSNLAYAGGRRPDGAVNTWRWLETNSWIAQRQRQRADVPRRSSAPSPTPVTTPFPNPLPRPPPQTHSQSFFTCTVLCKLAFRRCARGPRAAGAAGRSGRTGPWGR